jgi:hypothetical protein
MNIKTFIKPCLVVVLTGFLGTSYGQKISDIDLSKIDPATINNSVNVFNKTKGVIKFLQKPYYIIPALAYNRYDGLQLGATLFRNPLRFKRDYYAIAPMFGFGTGSLVGSAEYKRKVKDKLTLGATLKTYHDRKGTDLVGNWNTRFMKFAPNVDWKISSPESAHRAHLTFDGMYILNQTYNGPIERISSNHRGVYRFGWEHELRSTASPYRYNINLEGSHFNSNGTQAYLKLTAQAIWHLKFDIGENKYRFSARAHAAGYVLNTMRNGLFPFPLQLASRSITDYNYEYGLFGRTDQDNVWSQQVVTDEGGGFKTPLAISAADGSSNTFVAAANFKCDIPINFFIKAKSVINIRPYLDLGYFKNTASSVTVKGFGDEIFANGGLNIDIADGLCAFYFPLVSTNNINDQLKTQGSYMSRISFSVDLNRINPLTWFPGQKPVRF